MQGSEDHAEGVGDQGHRQRRGKPSGGRAGNHQQQQEQQVVGALHHAEDPGAQRVQDHRPAGPGTVEPGDRSARGEECVGRHAAECDDGEVLVVGSGDPIERRLHDQAVDRALEGEEQPRVEHVVVGQLVADHRAADERRGRRQPQMFLDQGGNPLDSGVELVVGDHISAAPLQSAESHQVELQPDVRLVPADAGRRLAVREIVRFRGRSDPGGAEGEQHERAKQDPILHGCVS
jgi:hypothetical protein